MKYIYGWEQPGNHWYYRRYATTNVVVSLVRLNRPDEPPLWLMTHYPTPETPISKTSTQHYYTESPKPIMKMLDKWLIERGYRTIPFSAGVMI